MIVRIILKHTYQPPIDTPASISWETVDLDSNDVIGATKATEYLFRALHETSNYTRSEVVGAEPVKPPFPGDDKS